jgi:hypothetical protein
MKQKQEQEQIDQRLRLDCKEDSKILYRKIMCFTAVVAIKE